LLSNDPTGRLWIPSLLSEATLNQDLAPTLVDDADDRGIWLQPYQRWVDRELRQWFGVEVEYEACFEFLLAPPNNLLVWLLNHPEQLVPRDDWRKSMRNQDHILLREQLLGEHGETAQMQAKRLATEALNRYGVEKSDKRWWAFEGFTKVDCLLETQKTVFVFEGKRTEPQSPAVSWLPRRNQVIRGSAEQAVRCNADGRAEC
jgi:hypothetical protein